MRFKLRLLVVLCVLVASVLSPCRARAQTAWFWALQLRDSRTGVLPSTLGISERVSSPRETIFGTLPNSGMVGEVAVTQSVLSIGDLVPLPSFADGSRATDSEIFWTAQLWQADFEIDRQLSFVGDASASFAGRQLIGANVYWGYSPPLKVLVLVNVVAIRPHDNRRSNR